MHSPFASLQHTIKSHRIESSAGQQFYSSIIQADELMINA